MTLLRTLTAAIMTGGLVLAACRPEDGAGRGELHPAPALPALELLDRPARKQLADLDAVVAGLVGRSTVPDQRLGRAFGELGKAYHAYRYLGEALICYHNARRLLPEELAWAYYFGHVARDLGRYRESDAAFRDASRLAPGHLPSLVWRAENALDQGRLEEAQEVLREVTAVDPQSLAARIGLGRAALQQGDFATAAEELERARELLPGDSRIHYSLGLAYRGLGDAVRAATHFDEVSTDHLQSPSAGGLEDPLLREVEALASGAMAHEHRGLRAAARGDFRLAAIEFKQTIALDPGRRDARHNLGLALLRTGRRREAVEQLEGLLEDAPGYAPTRVLLANILAEEGRFEASERHLRAAVEADGGSAVARLRFAETLSRRGRPEVALEHFRRARDLDPARTEARFGVAASLLQLAEFRPALAELEEGVAGFPGDRRLQLLLARLLAAAPLDELRDGPRALELAPVKDGDTTVSAAETAAMVYAELADFDGAVLWQRAALSALDSGEAAARARRRLARYQRSVPCRSPWEPGEELSAELVEEPRRRR